jgi:hypothetical protein
MFNLNHLIMISAVSKSFIAPTMAPCFGVQTPNSTDIN